MGRVEVAATGQGMGFVQDLSMDYFFYQLKLGQSYPRQLCYLSIVAFYSVTLWWAFHLVRAYTEGGGQLSYTFPLCIKCKKGEGGPDSMSNCVRTYYMEGLYPTWDGLGL